MFEIKFEKKNEINESVELLINEQKAEELSGNLINLEKVVEDEKQNLYERSRALLKKEISNYSYAFENECGVFLIERKYAKTVDEAEKYVLDFIKEIIRDDLSSISIVKE